MPKVIDHDARRREIVDATLRVFRRQGLDAATSRAIAQELGMAVGGLWYYFQDLDAVISAAHDTIFRRTQERVITSVKNHRGLGALRHMLNEVLPMNPETQFEARVVVGYWGRVAADESLAQTQRDAEGEWHQMIGGFLQDAMDDGELRSDTPITDLVEVIIAVSLAEQTKWVTRSMFPSIRNPVDLVEFCLSPYRTYDASLPGG